MESDPRDDILTVEDASSSSSEDDSVSIEENTLENENSDGNLSIQSSQACTQNQRNKRSTVWKFLKEVSKLEDGKSKVKCKLCKNEYVFDLKQGTSNMRRHLRTVCLQRHKALKILTPVVSGDTRKGLHFDQVAFRETLAKSIIRHEYPFQYLEEPCLDWRQPLDILMYWKSIEYRFPVLAKMARDILTIPISTVASEAAFSSGGRVLDQYRTSLTPSTVEALICTKDWMFGSNVVMKTDDDDLEVDLLTDSSTSTSTSTSRASSSKRTKVAT